MSIVIPIAPEKDCFTETGFVYMRNDDRVDIYEHKKKMLRVGVDWVKSELFIESISPIRKHFKSGKRRTGKLEIPSTELVREILKSL